MQQMVAYKEHKVYTNSCSGSQGRTLSPISLHFVNFSCLCLAVSVAHAVEPSPILSSIIAALPYLVKVNIQNSIPAYFYTTVALQCGKDAGMGLCIFTSTFTSPYLVCVLFGIAFPHLFTFVMLFLYFLDVNFS